MHPEISPTNTTEKHGTDKPKIVYKTRTYIFLVGVCMSQVGLRGFFDPTHHGGSKKIQPNPTHHISSTQPTWVRLGWVEPMDLTNFYYYYYY